MIHPGLASQHAVSLPLKSRPAYRLALISTFIVTLLGAVYFVFMVFLAAGGGMTMPPPEAAQLFGGVSTAVAALLLPVLFVSLHYLAPDDSKVYTLLGVVFCTLFSAFVGINRFAQLSVVRLSVLEGNTEGLAWFMPYESRSVFFALEMIGWGIMLSLGVFFLALALGKKGLQGAARRTFFLYTVLGLVSGISFIVNSPLSVIGFVAWGFVLFLGTGLLFLSLLHYDRNWATVNISKTD